MTVSKWSMLILVLLFALVTGSISCGGQPAPAASLQSPSESTVVSTVSGEVMVMKAGADTWSQVSPGMALGTGDRIKTGPGSNALITFFEGTTIELAADTEVAVAELGVVEGTGSTAIKLRQQIGKTTSRVQKLVDPASRYEIETPDGAAVARGSVGDVIVTEGNSTTIINRQGQWFAIFNGLWIPIPQGYQITFVRGQLVIPVPVPVPPPIIVPPPSVPSELLTPGRNRSSPGPIPISAIAITKTADRTQACVDDNIIYTYQVTNAGNTPLSNILVTDDRAGTATYQSGDANGDNKLDMYETWIFTASYTVVAQGKTSFVLVNTATASGREPLYRLLITAQDTTGVEILIPCPGR
ncbi:FecR domain-containing protein [Chloroflexota bacterium]